MKNLQVKRRVQIVLRSNMREKQIFDSIGPFNRQSVEVNQMKASERAAQIWTGLALAASNRQVLTYDILSKITGVPRPGLGQLLEPIQSYCLVQGLPPLTILVVSQDSGLPGAGFIAAQDIPTTQQRVFEFDWLGHGAPSVAQLEDAVSQKPSNGPQT